MSAPTKRAPARKRAPAKPTKAALPNPPGQDLAPDPSPPSQGLSARDQRIQQLTGVDVQEALGILQQRVGELETQRLMDGRVIARLVERIQQLDPDDPVAADAAAGQEDL